MSKLRQLYPLESAEMTDRPEFVQCVACLHPIPKGASICSVCRSYQAGWKNWLQYGSGITAFLLVIASTGTWLAGNARSYLWYRDDVKVIKANTFSGAVVWNRGDREVFIADLQFYMTGRTENWVAPHIVFDEKISSGQFLRREFSKASGKKDQLAVIRGASATDFESDISRAVNGDPCYDLAFFEKSDPALGELGQMAGPTLDTFPLDGYLRYWSMSGSNAIYVPLLGVGVVLGCMTAAPKP